jgi:ABC-type lipoprotein release transport system permease subunit
MLFLSLGFFIILSAVVLLRLAVNTYIDSRKEQVFTFHALGYRHSAIFRIFFAESALIAITGSVAGALLGVVVNAVIIESLNSVWRGAVQTDTLSAYAGTGQILTGFITTVLMLFLFINITVRNHLRKIAGQGGKNTEKTATTGRFTFSVVVFAISVILLIASYILNDSAIILSYASGVLLLVAILLLWREFSLNRFSFGTKKSEKKLNVSGSYYSAYPDSAVMPVLFIAAGLFAVVITGVNRLGLNENSFSPSGGTGGFDIWAETTLSVNEDMNSKKGRREFGLDENIIDGISFVSGKRLSGDDASCLNLNNVATPPLLGIDPAEFSERRAFSFSNLTGAADPSDPWKILSSDPGIRTIYGFADQTVLQWGLKIKTGDTLKYRDEAGQQLNIIIAGGLESSVFQGYIIIDVEKFDRYFPTVSGYSVFLADGIKENADTAISILRNRLEGFGIDAMPAGDRLASFFIVTNTYLAVFTILGALGMILGVAGLGFAITRNYNSRKKEFSLLLALGYRISEIRGIIMAEQKLILTAGVLGGLIPALVATLPSLSDGSSVPWLTIAVLTAAIIATGLISIALAVRNINEDSLVAELRKE